MISLDARLRRLEKTRDGDPGYVLLFGDDPEPEGLPVGTVVIRFPEQCRDV